MATNIYCPFGPISGSIGDITFVYRRGKQIIYLKPDPTKNKKPNVYFLNVDMLMALLMRMYFLLKPLFHNYWEKSRKYPVEHTRFIKQNLGPLYKSIPDKKQLLSSTNWINLSSMVPAYGGKLSEPKFNIQNLTYESDRLHLKWETQTWKDGKPDDTVNILIIYCAPSNSVVTQSASLSTFCLAEGGSSLNDKDDTTFDYLFEAPLIETPDSVIPVDQLTILNSTLPNSLTRNYKIKMFYAKTKRCNEEATLFIPANIVTQSASLSTFCLAEGGSSLNSSDIKEKFNLQSLGIFLFFSNETTYSDIYISST